MSDDYVEIPVSIFLTDYAVEIDRLTRLIDVEVANIKAELHKRLPPGANMRESQMYAPFCEAINTAMKGSRCVLRDTAGRSKGLSATLIPDFTVYDTASGNNAWDLDINSESSKQDSDRENYAADVCFAWAASIVELKRKATDEILADTDTDAFDLVQGSSGRMLQYVGEIFLRQHREFVFTVFVSGKLARLERWDRCDAVVSQPFNWYDDPAPLLHFFAWLGAASPAQQGFDTSIRPASIAQVQELEEYKEMLRRNWEEERAERVKSWKAENEVVNGKQARGGQEGAEGAKDMEKDDFEVEPNNLDYNRRVFEFVREMTEDARLYPINQLQFKVEDLVQETTPPDSLVHKAKGKTLTLLLGKYHVPSHSPTGRGTKGYFAYVVGMQRLVFVKMSWRSDSPDIVPELETYKRLYQKRVPFLAQVLGGGDVSHDLSVCEEGKDAEGNALRLATFTQERVEGEKGQWKTPKRIGYRVIIETLGVPLREYYNSYALIYAVIQAFEAHRVAWEVAEILHRDISAGNILIDLTSDNKLKPNAFLSDWDLSMPKLKLKTATQHHRAGTLPFMSGPLLKYPRKPNDLPDDIESFVHLIYYHLLRFHPHNMMPAKGDEESKKPLAVFVTEYFYREVKTPSGHYWGGTRKFETFRTSRLPFTLMDQDESLLNIFFQAVHEMCHTHYQSIDESALERYLLPEQTRRRPVHHYAVPQQEAPPYVPGALDGSLLAAGRSLRDFIDPVQTCSRPADPFATHTAFGALLVAAGRAGIESKGSAESWRKADKTDDQFEGLQRMARIPDKSNSTSVSQWSSSERSSQTVDVLDDAQVEGPKKKKSKLSHSHGV